MSVLDVFHLDFKFNSATAVLDETNKKLDATEKKATKAQRATSKSFFSLSSFKGLGFLSSLIGGFAIMSKMKALIVSSFKTQSAQFKQLQDNITKLNQFFNDVAMGIAEKLIPLLNAIVKFVTDIIFSKPVMKVLSGIGDYVFFILHRFGELVKSATAGLKQLNNMTSGWAVKLALVAIGILYVIKNFGLLAAFARKNLFLVALAALLLILDDINVYLKGGDSLIGSLEKKYGKFASRTVYALSLVIGTFGLFGTKGLAVLGSLAKGFIKLSLIMLSNPVFLVIAAITALIAVCIDLWKGLKGGKSYVNDFFKEWFKFDLVDYIKGIYQKIISLFSDLVTFVTSLINGNWAVAWERASNIVASVFKTFMSIFRMPFDLLMFLIDLVSEALGFGKATESMKKAFASACDSVKDLFKSLIDTITGWWDGFVDKIQSGMAFVKKGLNFVTGSKTTQAIDKRTASSGTIPTTARQITNSTSLSNHRTSQSQVQNNHVRNNVTVNVRTDDPVKLAHGLQQNLAKGPVSRGMSTRQEY